MAVKVGSARIDENGKAHGGQAGDQTGKEVSTQSWYLHSKGWRVYRAKNPSVAEKIAQCMERACKNSKIGYDQDSRNTLYKEAEPFGFDVSKVTTACETDCSALVRVCCAYAGITGLPEGFRFAGVISYSGAVFSRKGKCEWTVQPPAPTLFLHGTSDELVTYDKIKFFNMGFFGTNSLVERFEKFDYPYMCLRFDSRYHEVAAFMLTCFDQAQWFIDKYVFQKKNWQIDATVSDPEMDIAKPWTFTAKDIYGK